MGSTGKIPTDVGELWKRAKSGRRDGHYYVALFGLRKYEPQQVAEQVRRGLSWSAFERFQRNIELPLKLLAQVAVIPERTMARRRDSGRFEPDETDRLLRLSRIVARAIELFEGSVVDARSWLTSPVVALGGRSPIDLVSTDVGTIEIENLIGRLTHGLPA